VFSIFGPSHTHSQLNHQTHIAVEQWFNDIALQPFNQLERIMEKQYSVNAKGKNSYLPNVSRLERTPIHFIAGGRNQIFLPETSLRTFEWLKEHNGPHMYSRKVYQAYAHMDFFIGKNAAQDIYGDLLEVLRSHSS
jgi:hypothetical protein